MPVSLRATHLLVLAITAFPSVCLQDGAWLHTVDAVVPLKPHTSVVALLQEAGRQNLTSPGHGYGHENDVHGHVENPPSAPYMELPPRMGPARQYPTSEREDWLESENKKLRQELTGARIDALNVELIGSTRHHSLDPTTGAVSVMLLGAIAFQMALFYLVNWPDEDIQYYTYHVIGRAISIFVSVLIFDAVQGLVNMHFHLEHAPQVKVIGMSVLQLLVWFAIMQLVTAHTSGAMPYSAELPDIEEVPASERKQLQDKLRTRRLNIKCWSGMLTHITGFAAIALWSNVQQAAFFRQSFLSAALVVPMAFCSIFLLYQGTDYLRYYIALVGDGEISTSEELWDEESEEAENDVMAMCLSFTSVQAFQFLFLGALPDEKGTLPPDTQQLNWDRDCYLLFLVAMGCAAATYTTFRLADRLCHLNKRNEDMRTRLALIFVNYSSMSFGWCIYYGLKAGVHFFFPHMQTEGLIAKIVIALFVSTLSFIIIFFLDFLADRQKSGSEEQRAIAKVILAKGFLIGFSWESCFATAFHCICHGFGRWVGCANLGLCTVLCIVVLPAYRRYILPEMERRLLVLHNHHKTELVEEKALGIAKKKKDGRNQPRGNKGAEQVQRKATTYGAMGR